MSDVRPTGAATPVTRVQKAMAVVNERHQAHVQARIALARLGREFDAMKEQEHQLKVQYKTAYDELEAAMSEEINQ